jgi:ATP-dependent DNA ligase
MSLPSNFRPAKPLTLDTLEELDNYPYYVQPKLDGIRCVVNEGKAYSNTLKEIPNKNIRKYFADYFTTKYFTDGELYIRGKSFNEIQSVVMSEDADDSEICYVIFDSAIDEDHLKSADYRHRLPWFESSICFTTKTFPVGSYFCHNISEAITAENDYIRLGYEGIVIRHISSMYKFGRATKDFYKFKRLEDAEARIIDTVELMHNGNDKFYDERNLAKRSSHKDNKYSSGMAGSLQVIGVNGKYKDKIFFVSLGSCSHRERRWYLQEAKSNKDRIITYTMAKHRGTLEAPSEPRLKCFRFEV